VIEYLSGVCRQVHIDVQRIPITSVPVDHDELESWLVKRFQEKDRYLKLTFNTITIVYVRRIVYFKLVKILLCIRNYMAYRNLLKAEMRF